VDITGSMWWILAYAYSNGNVTGIVKNSMKLVNKSWRWSQHGLKQSPTLRFVDNIKLLQTGDEENHWEPGIEKTGKNLTPGGQDDLN